MTRLRLVKTKDELDADSARARLLLAMDNMGLTKGQRLSLTTLVASYGAAQYKAGQSRGEYVEGGAA